MSLRIFLLCSLLSATAWAAPVFNVREHGAKGDGIALDTAAINAAITAASDKGGGTVVFPAGTYLSFSIRLKSNITLLLEEGATLLAATPQEGFGAYDPPEPNEWGDKLQYQDFGHSHWLNSLIWGENLEDIAIIGRGLINGKGLVRNAGYGGGPRSTGPNGTLPPQMRSAIPSAVTTSGTGTGPPARNPVGLGNKAIALKNCRKVLLRDFSILNGGHFALLATGTDYLKIENLTVDTNRDGFDLDACRHVRVEGCTVNTPNDDAIVLKTSHALGEIRATEEVIITDCTVSGFDVGTVLDGTRQRTMERAPDRDGPTGRIKIGTESNGDFRNITISNCTFVHSRGLAIESVDGAVIEDVTVKNITMKEVTNTSIFLRLGNRARGPEGTPVGAIRRVTISNVTAKDADARYGAVLLAGLPGHPIEDVTLEDVMISSKGGLTPQIVAEQPVNLVNSFFLRGNEPGATGPRDPLAVPLREKAYPEPSMFGLLPAGAIYARHVKDLIVRNITVNFIRPDTRPRVVLDSVGQVTLDHLNIEPADTHPVFVLRNVQRFEITRSPGVPDVRHENADALSF